MAGWGALLAGQVLVAHSDKETELIVVSTPYPSDDLPLLSLVPVPSWSREPRGDPVFSTVGSQGEAGGHCFLSTY